MRPLLLALSASAALATAASAQRPDHLPEVRPGARVRVEGPATRRLTGTVLQRTGDSIVVARSADAHARLALRALTRVDVSRGGSRGSGARRGAVTGAKVLGGIGLAAGVFVCIANPDDSCAEAVVAFPVALGVGGAFWGGVAGFALGGERWDTVHRSDRVSVTPVTRPLQVGVALRF